MSSRANELQDQGGVFFVLVFLSQTAQLAPAAGKEIKPEDGGPGLNDKREARALPESQAEAHGSQQGGPLSERHVRARGRAVNHFSSRGGDVMRTFPV